MYIFDHDTVRKHWIVFVPHAVMYDVIYSDGRYDSFMCVTFSVLNARLL